MNVLERSIDNACPERDPDRVMAKAAGKIEGFFVKQRAGFHYVHALMLVALVVLIIVPAFLPYPPDDATAFDSFSLLARFIVWGLWFPLVFVSVIFFGRLWCGLLCPQGALSEYTTKAGLNRPVPRWLRWGGVPIFSFVIITIIGQLVGIRDYPLPAMEVFIGTTLIAVLVGFLYGRERRVWCRYLCPVGPLLGILSRLGIVGFEKNGGNGGGCVCPTFINLSAKTASSNCIECFRCVNPEEPGSLHLRLRRPGQEIEEIGKRDMNLWEVVFLFAATGLALGAFHWLANPIYIEYRSMLGGFFLDIGLAGFIGKSGPWWLMVNYPWAGEVFNWLDFISIATFMLISMVGVASVLFLLTVLSAIVVKRGGGGEGSLLLTVTKFGYLYAPVALVSFVLGLGMMLFQSLSIFGLTGETIKAVQALFFVLGALWSVYLAAKLQGFGPAIIPSILGIGLVAFFWYEVLF
jgi:hypothetical protein